MLARIFGRRDEVAAVFGLLIQDARTKYEWVSPVDQMCSIWMKQASSHYDSCSRRPYGRTKPRGTEDIIYRRDLESQGPSKESLWKPHISICDIKYPLARPRENHHLILVLVKEEHLSPFHWFPIHCNPTRVSNKIRVGGERAKKSSHIFSPEGPTHNQPCHAILEEVGMVVGREGR